MQRHGSTGQDAARALANTLQNIERGADAIDQEDSLDKKIMREVTAALQCEYGFSAADLERYSRHLSCRLLPQASLEWQPDYGIGIFGLASLLGAPADEIACAIASRLSSSAHATFERVMHAGPYINVRLTSPALLRAATASLRTTQHPSSASADAPPVVALFSMLDVTQTLTDATLYDLLATEAVARAHELRGRSVIRVSRIEDWGTQFCDLLAAREWYAPGKALIQLDTPRMLDAFASERKQHLKLRRVIQRYRRSLAAKEPEILQQFADFAAMNRERSGALYRSLGIAMDVEIRDAFLERWTDRIVARLRGWPRVRTEANGAAYIEADPSILIRTPHRTGTKLTYSLAALLFCFEAFTPAMIVFSARNDQHARPEDIAAIARGLHSGGATELDRAESSARAQTGTRIEPIALRFKEATSVESLDALKEPLRAALLPEITASHAGLPEQTASTVADLAADAIIRWELLHHGRLERHRNPHESAAPVRRNEAMRVLRSLVRCRTNIASGHKPPLPIDATDSTLFTSERERALALQLAQFSPITQRMGDRCDTAPLTGYLSRLAREYAKLPRHVCPTNVDLGYCRTVEHALHILGMQPPSYL